MFAEYDVHPVVRIHSGGAIRSSDIAFTLGAKGALIQKAHEYTGEIEVF